MIALAGVLAAFVAGLLTERWLGRRRRVPLDPPEDAIAAAVATTAVQPADEEPAGSEHSTQLLVLFSGALRDMLRVLRRANAPAETTAPVERLAWQARMLVSGPRPMQAQPTSPISLLQEAAEEVEALRLGKVNASWSVRSRQPIHVDPERARGAFRELLVAAVTAVGEGGRLAIRVRQGERRSYPVEVEIEAGRRGVELESLAFLVARRVLEGQGCQVELDGSTMRVALRALGAEPPEISD